MTLTVSYCCCGCSLPSGTKLIAVFLLVSSICAGKLSVATLYTVIWHRAQPLLADLMFLWTWSLTLREQRRPRMFENRDLRGIFEPKWDEVTGEWGKLHYEEFNDLNSSPNILRVKKSWRTRWAEHVAHMGEGRGVWKVLVGKTEGKSHWRDPGVNGRIILSWIFGKWDVGVWTESS